MLKDTLLLTLGAIDAWMFSGALDLLLAATSARVGSPANVPYWLHLPQHVADFLQK